MLSSSWAYFYLTCFFPFNSAFIFISAIVLFLSMAFVFSYLLWLFNSTFIFLVILCWSDLWRILNWRDKLYLLHLKENVSISPLRMTFAGFFFFPHRYSLSMKRSSLLFLTYWSFYFYNHCPDWAIPPSLGLGIYNYCLLLLLMRISLCFSEVSEFPFIKKKKKNFSCTVFGHTFCHHTNGLRTQRIHASELGKTKMQL